MTEELREALGGFKIWRCPSSGEEPVAYMGQFRPPHGQFFITAKDLRDLGFAPGEYTVLVPEEFRLKFSSKWQKITVPE
jgi:hypothetical protein